MIRDLKIDFRRNRGNYKGMFVVFSYRIVSFLFSNKYLIVRILSLPLYWLYSFIFIWILGIEIPLNTRIGYGLQLWHGVGLVINKKVVIGSFCVLRHSTTIGNKVPGGGCPVIGDNVEIGAHCIIIGDIVIGNNVTVGAGTIVAKSIPDNTLAYGNPLRLFSKLP